MTDRGLFSNDEIARLEQLRFRRMSGIWPPPVQVRFVDRHPLRMDVELLLQHLPDRLTYRCTMSREHSTGVNLRFSTHFQTPLTEPIEPTLAEVLRWLAVSAAHISVAEDMSLWAAFHMHAANDARRNIPYRGLVRETSCVEQFVESLTAEIALLREFLGEAAFRDLLASADAIA